MIKIVILVLVNVLHILTLYINHIMCMTLQTFASNHDTLECTSISNIILCLNNTYEFNLACMLLHTMLLRNFIRVDIFVAPTFSFEWNKEVLDLTVLASPCAHNTH